VTASIHKRFIASRPVGGSYTFGGRQGRMSPTRQRAFDELVPRYLVDLPVDLALDADRIIVEIGCGKGDATAAMAATDVGSLVIACEANGAMIANLAALLDEADITNVRLWLGDAFDLLAALGPATVAEIRVWFPDPWPKPRHAGKRLITPLRLGLLTDALQVGGVLRLATDDAAYAGEALAAIDAQDRLAGRIVARPDARPITRFEERGLRDGRIATDVEAVRTS
jgi:tRNA (guanine-N7-)-methyltransferase